MATVNYGTDLSGVTDIDPTMREVSGNRLLAEACARRLVTARGTLFDDLTYGYDISQFINDDFDLSTIGQLQSGIQGELLKDQRVLAVTATVTYTAGILIVTVNLTGALGPFTLVLSVSSVTATILLVTP